MSDSRTFPALPEEIWLQIATYIALDPGNVVIRPRLWASISAGVTLFRAGGLPIAFRLHPSTRRSALQNYHHVFATINRLGTLFNFDLDTLDVCTAMPNWHVRYSPAVLPDLARVRYLDARDLVVCRVNNREQRWIFDFASLSPYTNLQRLRVPRNRAALAAGVLPGGGFANIVDYDNQGRREFARWWTTNNMPATSPVPEIVFY